MVHVITTDKHTVWRDHRITFTCFRLPAHWLAVEVGRWKNACGSPPLEERLCPCGQVQTEAHVNEQCPSSQYIRDMRVI